MTDPRAVVHQPFFNQVNLLLIQAAKLQNVLYQLINNHKLLENNLRKFTIW